MNYIRISLNLILIIVRFLVIYKVIKLLIISSISTEENYLNDLQWWICYLVFDIWFQLSISFEKNDEKD